jgi:hypothetical protein
MYIKPHTTLVATFENLKKINLKINFMTGIEKDIELTLSEKIDHYIGILKIGDIYLGITLKKNLFADRSKDTPEVIGTIRPITGEQEQPCEIIMYYFEKEKKYKGFLIFPTGREEAENI